MKLKKVKDGTETTYDIEASLDKINGINGTASDINQKLGKIEETYTAAEKAKVNAIPNDPKYTDTVYDDTNIKNRITDVEDKLNGSGSVTFSNVTTTGLTTNGEVEIYGATPHIDFHYGNSSEDKTSRIIETTSGKLDLQAANGVLINGKKTANENVTLTADTSRVTDVSYTAKYNELLGAVFVRIYCKIKASMSVGYGYTLFNIDSRPPSYTAALSVKVGSNDNSAVTKKAAAYAKSSDVITIQPLDGDLNTYGIYITGFWFV